MNNQQFIARQRVKYFWKVLSRAGQRQVNDTTQVVDSFWQYESTPRSL